MELSKKKCVPCEAGGEPLEVEEIKKLLPQISGEWKLNEAGHIFRQFKFQDFKEAVSFVNKVADITESEGHHPDIKINYNRVTLELWTHAAKGLHENDFIVASKIENIL